MNITSGKIHKPKKVVIYGVEGIGKSTFAAQFPDTLFIDTEGSTGELDVKRFNPSPSSWEMLKSQIDYAINNKPCKTLVIDTVDWAERMCIKSVCDKHNKSGIEEFGYGNGYTYEAEEFGRFLNRLEDVISAGINVVLTAHALIRKFELPNEQGAFDRYELKLGKKTTNQIAPMVKEWADMVLFANYKTFTVATDKEGKKHKAQGGQRVMYTTHHPCWDAKNRYGLADELPFEYAQIAHIIETSAPAKTVSHPDFDEILDTEDDTPPTQPAKPVQPDDEYEGIPKALADLMKADNVTVKELQLAVANHGYYPISTPVQKYDESFINGRLVYDWNGVLNEIKKSREVPFN